MGLILASFGAAFVAYIILGSLYNYSRLRQFKGPPLAGFTEWWLFWQSWNARLNVAEYEAIQKYGKDRISLVNPCLRNKLTGINTGRIRRPDRPKPSYHRGC